MSWLSEWWHDAEDAVNGAWETTKEAFRDFINFYQEAMNEFWSWFGMVFIVGIGLTILGIAGAAYGVWSWIWGGLTEIGGWISSGWKWISGWATALYSYWKDFLSWMHWDDIKTVSDIGEIISPEYKQAVDDLYNEIAKVSDDLGLGSGYMLLALADARNVIMDTSSLLGRSYDIGEVAWIQNLTGYLGEFSDKAESYKNNPEGLLLDIQSYFEPEIIATRTGFQNIMIGFMDTSVKGLKETALNLVKLKDSMETAILHLPAKISGPLYRHMEAEFKAFDTFIDDKFTPAIDAVQGVTALLSELGTTHTKQIGDISGLLSNPGEVLANINALPEIERLRQEDMITEISNRAYRTESRERNEVVDEANKELVLIADALEKERKPPSFLRLEYEGKPRPVGIADGAFVSWQVGDY